MARDRLAGRDLPLTQELKATTLGVRRALEPILNRELESACGLPLRWFDVLFSCTRRRTGACQ